MSNIEVKVVADVSSLQTQFSIASAQARAVSAEFNALAREAAKTGDATGAISAKMLALAPDLLAAKSRATELKEQMSSLGHTAVETSAEIGGLGNALSTIRTGLATLGIGLGIGELVHLGEAAISSAENIYHQSEVLGITRDAYQAYTTSAADAGVAIDTVNMALLKFNKAQGEAQIGSKAQAEAFLELGVSANIPAQQALPAVAKALIGLDDAAERARLETVLFGRSGEEIQPALEQWALGTDTLIQKQKQLGEVIDDQSIAKAHQADVAWTQFTERLSATFTPAVVGLGTAFLDTGKWIEEASIKLEAWNKDLVDSLSSAREVAAENNRLFADLARQNAATPGGGQEQLGFTSTSRSGAPGIPGSSKADEQSEIANLTSIDQKLQERKELTLEIAAAQKALQDAKAFGDSAGIQAATVALADLKKQMDALNKPEAVPKGTKSASDKADVQAEVEFTRQAAAEMVQIDKSNLDTQLALAKTAFEEKRQILDDEVAAHAITGQQRYAQTVQLINQETAAEEKALRDQIAMDNTSLAEKIELANKIVVLEAQKNVQIAAAERQLTADIKAENEQRMESWRKAIDQIESAESQLVNDIFTKRQKLNIELEQIAAKFLQNEITNDARALAEHELVNLGILASDKATAQEGLIFKLAAWAAEKVGLIASAAADTSAAAAGAAASKAQAAAEIPALTGVAAMEAASAVAGIPVVGPALANAAFAQMVALGGSAGGMASLDVGTNYVPSDMIAQIHEGERIIPAADNASLIEAVRSGGGGSAPIVHFNINAMDVRGVRNWLNNPVVQQTFARTAARHLEKNPGSRANY